MNPTNLVLSKLPGAKPSGKGWVARCPAHEDRRPSLSISEGEDGRALLCCHASCTPEAIVAALGLTMADLMPSTSTKPNGRPKGGGFVDNNGGNSRKTYPTMEAAVAELERRHGPCSVRWDYANGDGELVGLIVRWDLPDGGKDIRPVSCNGHGWVVGGMQEPRPLYRLGDLLSRPGARVFVCEGEKATDTAAAVGLLATTSPHGSKSAAKADWAPLAGRVVVILPDNDAPGRQYAADVAAILARLTPPATAKIIPTGPDGLDLPEGGDIVELVQRYREAGKNDADILKDLEALIGQTEPASPAPTVPSVTAFVPFPLAALPEPVRSFVAKAARAIGCDPSFVALPLLAGLASAIGNTRRIQLKRGWTEPAIVWAVIVGESGTLKSPALELALRAIRKRQHTAMKEHAQAMEGYRADLLCYEKDVGVWKRGKAGSDPPTKPEEPVADRCWCDDTTVEALAVLLQQNWRGLLMVRDELAGWLGGFDRYAQGKGCDAQRWLEMHGGRSMMVDRKSGTPRTLYVPRAAVSIAGGIQPGTLRKALGVEHRENGLAARLLLACPPRKPKRWTEADIPPEAEDDIGILFDQLYSLQPTTNEDGESQPVILGLTPEGKSVWAKFFDEHAQEQADLTGDLAAAWSKLEGYTARLALVVHFVRWAAGDPTLASPDAVDAASIAAGVKLSRWFGNEDRRVYAILAEDDEDRDRRRLVELIGRKGSKVTVRELQQSTRLFKTADEAHAALTELVEAGIGRWENPAPGPTGGRPSQVFRLNEAPAVYETSVDSPENGGFVGVDNVDNATTGDDWGEA